MVGGIKKSCSDTLLEEESVRTSDVLLLLSKAEVRARSEHGFSMLTSSFASQHDRDARVASADASVTLRSLDRVRVGTGGSKTAHFWRQRWRQIVRTKYVLPDVPVCSWRW